MSLSPSSFFQEMDIKVCVPNLYSLFNLLISSFSENHFGKVNLFPMFLSEVTFQICLKLYKCCKYDHLSYLSPVGKQRDFLIPRQILHNSQYFNLRYCASSHVFSSLEFGLKRTSDARQKRYLIDIEYLYTPLISRIRIF